VKASSFCIQRLEVGAHNSSTERVQTGVGELLKPFDLFVDVAAFLTHSMKSQAAWDMTTNSGLTALVQKRGQCFGER
jgi:hypothetical protein